MTDERAVPASTFVELRAGMARGGIQAALLLNGGAAVVLMNLVGNVASAPRDGSLVVEFSLIKWSLATFAFGVFLAVATYAVAFMAMNAFVRDEESEAAHRFRKAGLGLIAGSLACFIAGVALAAASISAAASP